MQSNVKYNQLCDRELSGNAQEAAILCLLKLGAETLDVGKRRQSGKQQARGRAGRGMVRGKLGIQKTPPDMI